jgi:amidohydrolase
MLMGAAEVLAGMRANLAGSVKFIFQPAEEGPPPGEKGGASEMIAAGVLENPRPEAIFGLHVWPGEAGSIHTRAGGLMAAGDQLSIVVRGRQTHGALPWRGIDPIVISSQIVGALQTITARQTDVTLAPAVVSIGSIQGGVRWNIIPDSVVMTGTVRTFDAAMRRDVHDRIRRTVEKIAEASGATASVSIGLGYGIVHSDPALTGRMAPMLRRVTGGRLDLETRVMPSEDFSEYTKEIPGLFVFPGINRAGVSAEEAAPNHSPRFYVNEDALPAGVKAHVGFVLEYLRPESGVRSPESVPRSRSQGSGP